MGLRVRKSVKIAPGVKVNIGKKSVGVSAGNKYGGVSVNSKTGVSSRVSVPGTGVSYTNKISDNKKAQSKQTPSKHSPIAFFVAGVIFAVCSIAMLCVWVYTRDVIGNFGLYFALVFAPFSLFYFICSIKEKRKRK
jgi:cobalamin biosynthesis Mg chelatase CobN